MRSIVTLDYPPPRLFIATLLPQNLIVRHRGW